MYYITILFIGWYTKSSILASHYGTKHKLNGKYIDTAQVEDTLVVMASYGNDRSLK